MNYQQLIVQTIGKSLHLTAIGRYLRDHNTVPNGGRYPGFEDSFKGLIDDEFCDAVLTVQFYLVRETIENGLSSEILRRRIADYDITLRVSTYMCGDAVIVGALLAGFRCKCEDGSTVVIIYPRQYSV